MFDMEFLSQLLAANVQGIPLIIPIVLLTSFVKGFGVEGQVLKIVALVWALILAIAYQFAIVGVPQDFGQGFAMFFFAITFGLMASFSYDSLSGFIEKIFENVLSRQ